MFLRSLNLPKKHSFFLFGPRGVGKSTWLQQIEPLHNAHWFNFLDADLEHKIILNPSLFGEMIDCLPDSVSWVVVDEVQKIPFVLDEVHRQIEKNKKRFFALTGSSARKLKRGKANLLAGRAFSYHLHPLTFSELGKSFDLKEAMSFGTLPKIFSFEDDSESKKDFLRAYALTYLKEEIQMEGLVRDLTAFRRFLPLAAQENGQILSYTNFARDVGIDSKTIRSYFEILEDTWLGFTLPAYTRALRKRQVTHPKFYFFDPGVKRALSGELNIELREGTSEYGRAFEHLMLLEIFRYNDYAKKDFRFSYFATNDVEIDLVVERPGKPILFVEFKSSSQVKEKELRTLQTIVGEIKNAEGLCISRDAVPRKVGNIIVSPYQQALEYIERL